MRLWSISREIFELFYESDPIAMKVVSEDTKMVGIGGGMAEANGNCLEIIKESAFLNSL